MNLGVVGCGNISPLYFRAAQFFKGVKFVACSDLDLDLARVRAAEFGVPLVLSVDELLRHPEVETIVNLTVPAAHAGVSLRALRAGKHVYSEKPLATGLEDAWEVLKVARERDLRVACAPSTFLGAAVQTARKAVDDGLIGRVVAASAFMASRGMESWHPNPAPFYGPGGGPLLDIGPYYVAALVTLLGPVERVLGSARVTFPERTVGSGAKAGETFQVTTPTHVAGLLEFSSGAVATLTTSFDVWHSEVPKFEVYGSKGTLSLRAPNDFAGPVRVRGANDETWRELPLVNPYDDLPRDWGLALADFVQGVRENRPHRASGELAYHVLETLQAFFTAAETGRRVVLESTCERPAPLLQALR